VHFSLTAHTNSVANVAAQKSFNTFLRVFLRNRSFGEREQNCQLE